MVAHTFNPSTQEEEAGRSLSLRPMWTTKQVPGQAGRLCLKKKQMEKEEEGRRKGGGISYKPRKIWVLKTGGEMGKK